MESVPSGPASAATCNASKASADVPFLPLFAALASWSFLKIVFEFIVRRVNPAFYEDLKTDIRQKYEVYFGTWLGMVFKTIALTSCTAALFTTPAETDIYRLARPLSTAEQWCWGCRAVIYIQEMPHYAAIPELMIHHLMSVVAVVLLLGFKLPRRQIYLIWAGLHSELINNARRLLKMHQLLTPRIKWWIHLAMGIAILLFRVSGCFLAIIWALQGGLSGLAIVVNGGCLAIYLAYMIKLTLWEFGRTSLFTLDRTSTEGVKLVIADTWKVSLCSIFLGIGLVCLQVATLLIYHAHRGEASSESDLQSIAFAMWLAVVAGLVFPHIYARLLSAVSPLRDSKADCKLSPRPGFFATGVGVLLYSPTLTGTGIHRRSLAMCFLICLPVLEMFRHLGHVVASNAHHPNAGQQQNMDRPLEKGILVQGQDKHRTPGARPLFPVYLLAAHLDALVPACLAAVFAITDTVTEDGIGMAALYAVLSATMINFFADREMRTVKRSSGPCGESMEPSASVEWLSINQVLLGAELVGVSGLLGRYLQTAGGPYTPHVIAVSLGVGIVWASMHWLTRLQYRPRSARPPRPSRPPLRREASVSTIPITPTTESVPPSPTETPTTLGKRRGGGGGGLFTPRNIGLAAATGLGVMVLAAWYLDWAPEELTSVEQAFDKVRGGSSSAWWDWWMLMWKTVASWQVVLSTAAVALTPMLNQYLY